MPFRITLTRADVRAALDDQGYTAPRAAYLDAAISSRAAPGAAMDLNAAAEAKVNSQAGGAMDGRGFTSARGPLLDRLDALVSSRASPADVDAQLGGRGVTLARMAKLDLVGDQVTNSGSVAAAGNSAGLTVQLDTAGAGQARSVIEVRYSAGGPATFYAEGSDDGTTWYEGDSFSEPGAVTNKLIGYLNAHRFFRFRSPTTGIDLSFVVRAVL